MAERPPADTTPHVHFELEANGQQQPSNGGSEQRATSSDLTDAQLLSYSSAHCPPLSWSTPPEQHGDSIHAGVHDTASRHSRRSRSRQRPDSLPSRELHRIHSPFGRPLDRHPATLQDGIWTPLRKTADNTNDIPSYKANGRLSAASTAAVEEVLRSVHPDLSLPSSPSNTTADNATNRTNQRSQDSIMKKAKRWTRWAWQVIAPPGVPRRVIKGTTLFMLTVLLVLIEPISAALGPTGYLAATISLFIQPVRPIGAQLEALVLSILALAFTIAFNAVALALVVAINRAESLSAGQESQGSGRWLAMLFLLCGVFWVSWIRVRYPRLAQAGNISMLALVFGLTMHTTSTTFPHTSLSSIVYPTLAAAGLSLVVNLVVFPTTSGHARRQAMMNMLQQVREQLVSTTHEFLAPSLEISRPALSEHTCDTPCRDTSTQKPPLRGHKTRAERIQALVETKRALSLGIPQLRSFTKQAVYELSIARHDPYDYKTLANLVTRIQQHLASMVLALQREEAWIQQELALLREQHTPTPRRSFYSHADTPTALSGDELHGPDQTDAVSPRRLAERLHDLRARRTLEERGDIVLLARMVDITRDAANSLTDACAAVLDCMHVTVERDRFPGSGWSALCWLLFHGVPWLHWQPGKCQSASNTETGQNDQTRLSETLARALEQYDEAERNCAHEVYEHIQRTGQREEHFLAFGFVYSLRELAIILQEMLELQTKFVAGQRAAAQDSSGTTPTEQSADPRSSCWRVWWPSVGLRKWLRQHNQEVENYTSRTYFVEYAEEIREEKDATANNTDAQLASKDSDKRTRPALNTSSIRNRLLALGHWLRGYRVKFAAKMSLCTLIITLPAYVSKESDEFFQRNHGQWALITALFVLSIDMGTTFLFGLFRILGTIHGIVWALVVLVIDTNPSPYIVFFLLLIHALVCWRLICVPRTLKLGIVSLFTASTLILGQYSGSFGASDALELAVVRGVTVILALVISVVIHQLFWPFYARTELRKLLSLLMHELGQCFSLVFLLRVTDHDKETYAAGFHAVDRTVRRLQSGLARANALLDAAVNEPRLKGPFPADVYRRLIRAMRDICAWLISMRSAAVQSNPARVRHAMLPGLSQYRDLRASVLLYFHVLCGSLRSKLPLPAFLPSARAARLRALQTFRPQFYDDLPTPDAAEHCVMGDASMSTAADSPEESPGMRIIYWYAFSTGLSEVISGQETIGTLVRNLVGVDTMMLSMDDKEE